MITLSERKNTIHLIVNGQLDNNDYQRVLPLLRQAMDHHEHCNLIVEMNDYNGERIGDAWHNLKYELRNARRIQRIALVGPHGWKISMRNCMRPFIHSHINFFEKELIGVAKAWASTANYKGAVFV